MTSLLKAMLNKLKCPICHSMIDFFNGDRFKNFNYCCVSNYNHYMIYIETPFYMKDVDIPELKHELVNIFDENHKYSLHKFYKDGKISTMIEIINSDPEGRVIESFDDKRLSIDGDLFDFNNFDTTKVLKKIKTIFTFN